jgi:GT2 family glycosyltransferase
LISSGSIYLSVLDDDTIPDPTYLKRIISFLENSEETIGVSGLPVDPLSTIKRTKSNELMKYIKYLFFLDSTRSGTITKGGVNIGLRTTDSSPIESKWLIGCSIYKINKIRNLFYDSTMDGYSLGEDVIFSYKASTSGKLYLLPDVEFQHRQSSQQAHYKSNYWFKWASYRKTLISIMPGTRLKWFYYVWANLGQILMISFSRKGSSGLNRATSIVAIIRGTLRG